MTPRSGELHTLIHQVAQDREDLEALTRDVKTSEALATQPGTDEATLGVQALVERSAKIAAAVAAHKGRVNVEEVFKRDAGVSLQISQCITALETDLPFVNTGIGHIADVFAMRKAVDALSLQHQGAKPEDLSGLKARMTELSDHQDQMPLGLLAAHFTSKVQYETALAAHEKTVKEAEEARQAATAALEKEKTEVFGAYEAFYTAFGASNGDIAAIMAAITQLPADALASVNLALRGKDLAKADLQAFADHVRQLYEEVCTKYGVAPKEEPKYAFVAEVVKQAAAEAHKKEGEQVLGLYDTFFSTFGASKGEESFVRTAVTMLPEPVRKVAEEKFKDGVTQASCQAFLDHMYVLYTDACTFYGTAPVAKPTYDFLVVVPPKAPVALIAPVYVHGQEAKFLAEAAAQCTLMAGMDKDDATRMAVLQAIWASLKLKDAKGSKGFPEALRHDIYKAIGLDAGQKQRSAQDWGKNNLFADLDRFVRVVMARADVAAHLKASAPSTGAPAATANTSKAPVTSGAADPFEVDGKDPKGPPAASKGDDKKAKKKDPLDDPFDFDFGDGSGSTPGAARSKTGSGDSAPSVPAGGVKTTGTGDASVPKPTTPVRPPSPPVAPVKTGRSDAGDGSVPKPATPVRAPSPVVTRSGSVDVSAPPAPVKKGEQEMFLHLQHQ